MVEIVKTGKHLRERHCIVDIINKAIGISPLGMSVQDWDSLPYKGITILEALESKGFKVVRMSQEENTQLIEAAPELYSQLLMAVTRIELEVSSGCSAVLSAWLPGAQTALIKAKRKGQ